MRKLNTHKLTQTKTVRSYTKLRKTVEYAVKDSVSSMRTGNQLDNISIESVNTDSWGDTTIYTTKGYIEVQVKTGIFSTKPGK